jgi:hypothetical protein
VTSPPAEAELVVILLMAAVVTVGAVAASLIVNVTVLLFPVVGSAFFNQIEQPPSVAVADISKVKDSRDELYKAPVT